LPKPIEPEELATVVASLVKRNVVTYSTHSLSGECGQRA
jgi:hypothetical protein